MIILKFLCFLLSLIIPGFLLTCLFIKDRLPLLYRLALAYGLGAIFLGWQLFLLIFFWKIEITRLNIYLIWAGEMIILVLYFLRTGQMKLTGLRQLTKKALNYRPNLRNIKIFNVITCALILSQMVFLFFNVLARPPLAYDNLTVWQYKAKILFYEKPANFEPGQDFHSAGHLNYPWQAPLLQVWLYANLGEFNDQAANFLNVFYYLAILIIIYYFLQPRLGNFLSLLFVFFFATMPLPFYHAYNGYADLTLSYYLLVAFIFLFNWLNQPSKKNLTMTGLLLASSLLVKNEALIFALAAFLIILLKHLKEKKRLAALKQGGLYLLAIALPLLPWLIIKMKYQLSFSNVPAGLSYHGQVWQSLFQGLWLSNSFNLWWFMIIVCLIINLNRIYRQKELLFSWLFLFSIIGGFIMLYLFTEEYRYALDQTALSRNFLTLIPTSIIIVGLSLRLNKQYISPT